jgi:2-(1,2-epoxy-1,2-dihydrophenyl)acetyl-CoA isomerase
VKEGIIATMSQNHCRAIIADPRKEHPMSTSDNQQTPGTPQEQADPVLYECRDSIATITLNRPSTLNAMTPSLMAGISNAMVKVVADETVRVVIITGAGRGFCAGADLADVAAPRQPADNSGNNADLYNNAMRAIMNAPVPTIARVNGPAAGGGFGLALTCDLTIASHAAFFVATFGPKLGIVPDMGATWSIPLRTGRARALGITLLGDRISATQAEAWGLIWRAVPENEFDKEVQEIAERLKRASPGTVTRIRETIDQAIHHSFSEQLDLEMAHQEILIPRNMQEGAQAFMAKRDPTFSGERG